MESEGELAALGTAAALWAALASTAVLMTLHLLAPRIRRFPLVPEHRTASFAGGIAVSYVFLHLLPELAEGHSRLRELFGEEAAPSPVVELGIFVVALTGFLLFYGLERAAQRARGRGGDAGAVFWVHLGSYALYNAVITYTLSSTYRTGILFAVLFTAAMALHFVLSDRGLEEHYGSRFNRQLPRLVLAGALLAGWLLAAVAAPTRSVTVAVLTAFLAGSVLLNVFKEEVPEGRRSSFAWFLVGSGLYAALLTAVTAAGA
jgi:hypothetical protein